MEKISPDRKMIIAAVIAVVVILAIIITLASLMMPSSGSECDQMPSYTFFGRADRIDDGKISFDMTLSGDGIGNRIYTFVYGVRVSDQYFIKSQVVISHNETRLNVQDEISFPEEMIRIVGGVEDIECFMEVYEGPDLSGCLTGCGTESYH